MPFKMFYSKALEQIVRELLSCTLFVVIIFLLVKRKMKEICRILYNYTVCAVVVDFFAI